ncbi:hypothetical protein NRB56_08530 [Nocardia sp. RB56]|uniref:Uncharacterized protein n=2 Tax=Nocardia aurantia TaxID=2585199 RepID=A0A7K0DI14_9NOCA|nr:hypothetical protein [Nocardia aurantia]
MLAEDGVTVLLHLRGRTEDGVYYSGYEEFRPGDPEYDEMLPAARENPISTEEPERPVDAATLAAILQDSGLDPDEFTKE